MLDVQVVHRDRHLLVLAKPSGLPTTSPDGSDCLVERAKQLDPEATRLHASSRLDAEVTGLVTFARTREATHALLEARRQDRYRRRYLGLAVAAPELAAGSWLAPIGMDPSDPRKRVALAGADPKGKPSETHFQVLARTDRACLLDLRPRTGRTHQLRVHAAHAGVPLLGDRHYGGVPRIVLQDGRVLSARRVMLHCTQLELPDPDTGGTLALRVPVPADMVKLWLGLGGEPGPLAPLDQLGSPWSSGSGAGK